MKIQIPKKAKQAVEGVSLRDIPFLFERYEFFIIVIGVLIVFLVAGFLFYEHAYKTVRSRPAVSVETPKIQQSLFEQTIEELAKKKQPPSSDPIIDPFR